MSKRPSPPPPLRTLADLAAVQRDIAEHRAKKDADAAAQRAAAARVQAAQNLFMKAVGPVTRLPPRGLAELPRDLPPPIPVQAQLDEQRVLHEAISDGFDTSTLLDVDDALSFRRPGVGLEVTRKLRRGDWTMQAQIDLHGLRSDEARGALSAFVRDAHKRGLRCLRVVHGKGLGSPGKTPVLKGKVQGWLIQKKEVLAFVQATPAEGGAGALMVLLVPMERRNGSF